MSEKAFESSEGDSAKRFEGRVLTLLGDILRSINIMHSDMEEHFFLPRQDPQEEDSSAGMEDEDE